MDNLTENIEVAADTAEAEKEEAAAALGKFKDVKTLLKAYSDLEAEFTRRCQRLKELEGRNKADPSPDGAEDKPSQTEEQKLISSALSNERVRDAVIGEYLKSVSGTNAVTLLSGGGGVAAPKSTPKSVKDAVRLARQYLKG